MKLSLFQNPLQIVTAVPYPTLNRVWGTQQYLKKFYKSNIHMVKNRMVALFTTNKWLSTNPIKAGKL